MLSFLVLIIYTFYAFSLALMFDEIFFHDGIF